MLIAGFLHVANCPQEGGWSSSSPSHWSQGSLVWHHPCSPRCPVQWLLTAALLLFSSLPFSEMFSTQLSFETEILCLCISSCTHNRSHVPGSSCPGPCRLMASGCFGGGQHQHGGSLVLCYPRVGWLSWLKSYRTTIIRLTSVSHIYLKRRQDHSLLTSVTIYQPGERYR